MYDLIIRDATIIRSSGRLVTDVAVEGGKIVSMGGRISGAAKEEVNGVGRFLLPGFIDTQVRFHGANDPSVVDWGAGSRAAVRGGVTTAIELPSCADAPDEAMARLEHASQHAITNFGAWAKASEANLGLINDYWNRGLICGAYAQLDASRAFAESGLSAFAASFPGLLGVHIAENTHDADNMVMGMEYVIELVKQSAHPVHITSLSTAAELKALELVLDELPITVAATLSTLFLSDQAAPSPGAEPVVVPPIRGELDRRALWAAAKRGKINIFASGHTPFSQWESGQAGVPGVDMLLALLSCSVHHGRISLERLVEFCCEGPAKLLGLANKGEVKEGWDADLILISEGQNGRMESVDPSLGLSWSPYLNRRVGIAPHLVVVGGNVVSRDGQLVDELKLGSMAEFSRDRVLAQRAVGD